MIKSTEGRATNYTGGMTQITNYKSKSSEKLRTKTGAVTPAEKTKGKCEISGGKI